MIETFGIEFEQQSRERRAQSVNNRRKEISKFQCKLCSGYSRLSCNFRSLQPKFRFFNNRCDDFLSLLFMWKINLSLCAAFASPGISFDLGRKKANENWILFYVRASIVVNDPQLVLFAVISFENVETRNSELLLTFVLRWRWKDFGGNVQFWKLMLQIKL